MWRHNYSSQMQKICEYPSFNASGYILVDSDIFYCETFEQFTSGLLRPNVMRISGLKNILLVIIMYQNKFLCYIFTDISPIIRNVCVDYQLFVLTNKSSCHFRKDEIIYVPFITHIFAVTLVVNNNQAAEKNNGTGGERKQVFLFIYLRNGIRIFFRSLNFTYSSLQFSGVAIHFISNAILSSYSQPTEETNIAEERLAVMLQNRR